MRLMTPVSPLSHPWASLLLVLRLDWDFGEGNFWESSSHVHQSIILLGTILRTQMRLALGCVLGHDLMTDCHDEDMGIRYVDRINLATREIEVKRYPVRDVSPTQCCLVGTRFAKAPPGILS
ncbi:hypothetical protein BGW80DRAFT_1252668 [Lactifluus volemus]|nr:hypothetical protein BGW80DRAFT_1252668 [Lactifluus volemus]